MATKKSAKRSKSKVNKRKPTSKVRNTVARKKTVRRAARTVTRTVRRAAGGRGKLGGFLKKGIVGDTIAAVGAGVVVGAAAQRVSPQLAPFASLGAEFLTGGVVGTIAAELIKPFLGMQSILGNVLNLSGGSGQSTEMGQMV